MIEQFENPPLIPDSPLETPPEVISSGGEILASQVPTTNNPTWEFSDLLGGSNFEEGTGIAIDNLGNTYITGSTNSIDFPVTANAVQNNFAGGDEFENGDAFVTKYSPDGTWVDATSWKSKVTS